MTPHRATLLLALPALLALAACCPIPHYQQESPEMDGVLTWNGQPAADAPVALAINKQFGPDCAEGQAQTITDSSGAFHFDDTEYFEWAIVYGDRWDTWRLCFELPDGTRAIWEETDHWGGPPQQSLECRVEALAAPSDEPVTLKSVSPEADLAENTCLVTDIRPAPE
jgi:hypothetical protein